MSRTLSHLAPLICPPVVVISAVVKLLETDISFVQSTSVFYVSPWIVREENSFFIKENRSTALDGKTFKEHCVLFFL